MIIFKHIGNFNRTDKFFSGALKTNPKRILDMYGKQGVLALADATPKDTGETANSWAYEITVSKGSYSISWTNSNVVAGIPIVILIQYGHGTRNGGYVQGYDFINPALRPIFDRMAQNLWMEVTRL